MTSARPGASFLKDIDRIFNEGTVAGQFDEQLLKQFVRTGDELAFGALVARYGPMVLAVSRRLLRDKNYAEDAFQATFLVLVRRARSIHQGEMLGAWLHRVAVRVALEANRASVRRKAEERKAAERLTMSFQLDTDRDDWPSQLHEELERLPPRYRLPIVLCHLQDLTQAQAAEQLRLSFGTLRRRLARGRELLQTRLSRRGVGLSSGLTGSLLPTRVEATVPTDWVDAVIKAATAVAASRKGAAEAVSTTAAALAEGVLRAMFLTRLKLAASTLAVVAMVGAAFGVVLTRSGSEVDAPLLAKNSDVSSPKTLEPPLPLPADEHSIARAELPKNEPPSVTPEKPNGKFWAAINVQWPIKRRAEDTKPFSVYFALVDDGGGPVVPKIRSSQLFINGKAYEKWPKIASAVAEHSNNSPVFWFDSLTLDEGLVFGCHLEEVFSQPGIYRVQWAGEGFQSLEIKFRVMPKKEGHGKRFSLP